MPDFVMPLLLDLDISSLTMSLVNIASARGDETALADSVEAALRTVAHLEVNRVGDTVIARTDGGHAERVVVAGDLGTVPANDPLAYVEMGKLFGPGASDAKGALAMSLKAAAAGGYRRDVTFVYHAAGQGSPGSYDDEVRAADFALVAAPTGSAVVGSALEHPPSQRLIGLTEVDPVFDAAEPYDLARFAPLGTPAVAFGPGNLSLAGSPDEFVPTAQLAQCEFVLRQWLTT